MDAQSLITYLCSAKKEAEQAKLSRMEHNKQNFTMYNMMDDMTHKKKGQSKEFLPKVTMAVDQGANLIQQGLVDLGDWFRVEAKGGLREDEMQIKPKHIKSLLKDYLEKIDYYSCVGDQTKSGMLGSLIVLKVTGSMKEYPRYVSKKEEKDGKYTKTLVRIKDKYWCPKVEIIRQEDYFPDPTGPGMFEIQESTIDYYKLLQMSEGESAFYDKSAVLKLRDQQSSEAADKKHGKSVETNQNITNSSYRNQIKVTEYWGDVVDPSTGELVYENVVFAVANDRYLIKKPTPNPYWHKTSPFVAEPLIRIPNSVWHRAIMDAPAMLNRVLNELTNLTIDGGMMSVHGIKQLRTQWLDDPESVEDGISAGTTLTVNSQAPIGAKVLERIDTGAVQAETMTVLNLVQQEFNSAAMTNDFRQGVQSQRAVKATEVVEASQALTTMLSGIAKNLEEKVITATLDKMWKVICQHKDYLDPEVVKSVLGKQVGEKFIDMDVEDLFSETVNGCKFKVYGVSHTLNKQRSFTKLQAMLQTVASTEVLLEKFQEKYDFGKLLGEIMRSLDIDTARLESDVDETQVAALDQQMAENTGPDTQSQIPQAGAQENQGADTLAGVIPEAAFPGSPATEGQ